MSKSELSLNQGLSILYGVTLLGAIALLVFVSFLMAYPVMLLWNGCLVPAVSSVHHIGWLQAWGIGFLFSFLFKPSTYSPKHNTIGS